MAADDGKKDESITYRLSRSCALLNGSSTEWAGSVPNRIVPHWCEFVSMPVRICLDAHPLDEYQRIACLLDHAFRGLDELLMGDPIGGGVVDADAPIATDFDSIVWVRQIFRYDPPVVTAVRHLFENGARDQGLCQREHSGL